MRADGPGSRQSLGWGGHFLACPASGRPPLAKNPLGVGDCGSGRVTPPLNNKAYDVRLSKCERCRAEYHPSREDQSYCSPRCRRDAAYTRRCLKEGRRAQKRHLATPIARSVENGPFCPIETIPCKPTKSLVSTPIDILGKGCCWTGSAKLDPAVRERILWCEVGRYRSRPLGSPFLTFCFLRSDWLQGNLSLRGQHNEGRGRILSLFGVFSEVVFHPRDRLEP